MSLGIWVLIAVPLRTDTSSSTIIDIKHSLSDLTHLTHQPAGAPSDDGKPAKLSPRFEKRFAMLQLTPCYICVHTNPDICLDRPLRSAEAEDALPSSSERRPSQIRRSITAQSRSSTAPDLSSTTAGDQNAASGIVSPREYLRRYETTRRKPEVDFRRQQCPVM